MSTRRIFVLDPTAQSKRKQISMAVRPQNLEGKVLGIVWNSKPGGDVLLEAFAEKLNRRFKLGRILRHKKPGSSRGIATESLDELSAGCDFVLVGLGD
jgi:hypothetical protein